jgi:hypothetical protein
MNLLHAEMIVDQIGLSNRETATGADAFRISSNVRLILTNLQLLLSYIGN